MSAAYAVIYFYKAFFKHLPEHGGILRTVTLFLSISNPSFSVDSGKRSSSITLFAFFKSRLLGASRISPWSFNLFIETALRNIFHTF